MLSSLNVTIFKHDLYDEKFDPVLPAQELSSDTSLDCVVNRYAQELVDSDFLFFIHPNWWGQPPAILKGYIDRVIRPPYAFDFSPGDSGGGVPFGKLKGKYGIVLNASNTGKEREQNYFGDPMEQIWRQCIFAFCGIVDYHRRTFGIVADSSEEMRKTWLHEVEVLVEKIVDDAAGRDRRYSTK